MSADPSDSAAWSSRLGRFAARVRPGHLLAVTALAAVLGMAGLQAAALPGSQAATDAEDLKIEGVAPVEPEIAPGSVMDVGDLVDGFQGVPKSALQTAARERDDETWEAEPEPDYANIRRPHEEAVIHAPPQPEPAQHRAGPDRLFGFDAPGRDYRAEREARRSRWESRGDRYDGDEREDRSGGRDAPRRYRSAPDERDRRDAPARYDLRTENGRD